MVGLPEGWEIGRVRRVAQGDAELLPPDTPAVVDVAGSHESLNPSCTISFGGLCLVLSDDGEWYMGELGADGVIVCWGSYGSDLERAIRAL